MHQEMVLEVSFEDDLMSVGVISNYELDCGYRHTHEKGVDEGLRKRS